MKKVIVFCAAMLLCCQVVQGKTMATPVEKKLSISKQIQSFHKKFNVWKKSLTVNQKKYFADLFDQYDESYKNYKAKQHDAFEQELIVNLMDSLQHIMDNWQSLYKNYVEARIFNEVFEKWQAGALKAKLPAVQKYRHIFVKYEANPQDSMIHQQLLQQQRIIKDLMH